MQEITLYTDPMSRGMRVQAILDAFEIPHTTKILQLKEGDHKKPEYLAINPAGRVPTLTYGDLTLVESGAICLFLADLFGDKLNTPKVGTPERALLYQWVLFLQTTLEGSAMKGFDPSTKAQGQQEIAQLLPTMASRLKGPFVLGEQFSVLDVILHCEFSWYKMMDLFPNGLEPFETHYQAVSARLPKKN